MSLSLCDRSWAGWLKGSPICGLFPQTWCSASPTCTPVWRTVTETCGRRPRTRSPPSWCTWASTRWPRPLANWRWDRILLWSLLVNSAQTWAGFSGNGQSEKRSWIAGGYFSRFYIACFLILKTLKQYLKQCVPSLSSNKQNKPSFSVGIAFQEHPFYSEKTHCCDVIKNAITLVTLHGGNSGL